MYKYKAHTAKTTSINRNTSYEGETIEKKINRIVNNKEPIKDGAPLIYQERKEGVRPEYDIRTDRMEVALEAMDAVSRSYIAKREHRIGEQAKKAMETEAKTETKKETGGQSAQATEEKPS